MAYAIRPFRDADAEALSEIQHRAVVEIAPRAYSPDQIAAWRSRHYGAARYRERVAEGDAVFVAVDQRDHPVGYALMLTDGHLDHLYLHPDHTRRVLAEQLLDAAETFARDRGIKRLFSEASDLARPAFESAGYRMTHRREFSFDEVPIHNWAMEKPLT